MSGQWEQYAEPAARAAYEAGSPVWPWSALSDAERQPRIRRMRATLAVVGPLIAEDTRVRMVAAAARAVERDGACSERAKVAEEIVERLTARRSEITPGRPGWGYLSEAIDMVNEVCGTEAAS